VTWLLAAVASRKRNVILGAIAGFALALSVAAPAMAGTLKIQFTEWLIGAMRGSRSRGYRAKPDSTFLICSSARIESVEVYANVTGEARANVAWTVNGHRYPGMAYNLYTDSWGWVPPNYYEVGTFTIRIRHQAQTIATATLRLRTKRC
jgi:hypothetical protein